MKDGGLFISNPVAPTAECIEYVRALESNYGDVKYIVLSSLAIEHKGTSGVFSGFFPKSSVFVQPGQYAFPINLPTFFFYPLGKSVKEIPASSADAPWGDEIDHQILGPLKPPGQNIYFHNFSIMCNINALHDTRTYKVDYNMICISLMFYY